MSKFNRGDIVLYVGPDVENLGGSYMVVSVSVTDLVFVTSMPERPTTAMVSFWCVPDMLQIEERASYSLDVEPDFSITLSVDEGTMREELETAGFADEAVEKIMARRPFYEVIVQCAARLDGSLQVVEITGLP